MPSRSETSLRELRYVPNSLKWLLLVTGVLIALGTFNIYSATYYMNMHAGTVSYFHLIRHVIFLLVGIITWSLGAFLPKHVIRQGAGLWVGGCILLLLLVVVAGRNVNGATRWIMLSGVSMQPSEFAKVMAVIWTAAALAKLVDTQEKITIFSRFFRPFLHIGSKKKENSFRSMFQYFVPLYGPLVMAGFVLFQPDMGTAGMILFFPLFLYILVGLPKKEILLGMVIGFAAFCVLVLISPYRWERVMVLYDPFTYAKDQGYQIVQSLIAVGSGGFFGQTGGGGMSKFLYLPEQFTDFAFAVFCQEFGFLGALVMLSLYVLFLFFGFSTAAKLKDTYGALLVYGLTMLISVQGLINIAMVVGCFPVTGIPLPFISFGGSSLVTNTLAVGLIYGTTVQTLRHTDMEERRRRIDAMEGRSTSFSQLSGSVYQRQ